MVVKKIKIKRDTERERERCLASLFLSSSLLYCEEMEDFLAKKKEEEEEMEDTLGGGGRSCKIN